MAIYILVFFIGLILGECVQFGASYLCREDKSGRLLSCEHCKEKLDKIIFIPVIGAILCRQSCKEFKNKISIVCIWTQLLSGLCFVLIYNKLGIGILSVIYCMLTLVLIVITYVDFATYEIPVILNYIILTLGIFTVLVNFDNTMSHIIGFFAISLPIYILILATDGKAMGGGDCKLMAVAGLLLGWKLIVLAFFIGCIAGSVIHIIRIKVSNESHRLALGPYLALGIFVSMLYGNDMINWYLSYIK